ncbi:MAG: hypothetical protein ACE5IR_14105, partial [bacterium]
MDSAHVLGPKISRPANAGLEMTTVGVMSATPLLFVISREHKRLRNLGFGACIRPKDFSSGKRRTRNDNSGCDERNAPPLCHFEGAQAT